MGARGKVPKRTELRLGHNAKAELAEKVNVSGAVAVPRVGATWHPRAKAMYKALAKSGQALYMEPSDWQSAALACETMTSALKNHSAEMMKLAWRMFSDLMVTESMRRRAGIEIERKPANGATPPEEDVPDYSAGLTLVS